MLVCRSIKAGRLTLPLALFLVFATVKKLEFDKTQPITLVNVPAVDKRPTKSALKIRTHHSVNNPHHKPTDTKANTNSTPARKHAVDFF